MSDKTLDFIELFSEKWLEIGLGDIPVQFKEVEEPWQDCDVDIYIRTVKGCVRFSQSKSGCYIVKSNKGTKSSIQLKYILEDVITELVKSEVWNVISKIES